MYEKSHYVKAIKACRDFKSKYPDIDLVSEEAFFRDAPEAIKDQSVATDTSRLLMPKRLNFELHQVRSFMFMFMFMFIYIECFFFFFVEVIVCLCVFDSEERIV